jgi:hypothetical protein
MAWWNVVLFPSCGQSARDDVVQAAGSRRQAAGRQHKKKKGGMRDEKTRDERVRNGKREMSGAWAQREDETSSGAKRVGKSRAEPGQSRAEQRGKAGRAGRAQSWGKEEATGNGRVTGTGRVLTSIAGKPAAAFFLVRTAKQAHDGRGQGRRRRARWLANGRVCVIGLAGAGRAGWSGQGRRLLFGRGVGERGSQCAQRAAQSKSTRRNVTNGVGLPALWPPPISRL